ncbi:MAG: HipA N-terminal domain-containing protein [Candidatus Enteromonas sp.]|nr:HipA N-terminal domain-containing protein [Candidatus Enteromonas sp.]
MIAEIKLWGTLVGYLSDGAENAIHFTYYPSFVSRGVEISPITLKLRREPYSFPRLTSDTFRRLPGLFADSLPDKFGRRVINEYLLSIGGTKIRSLRLRNSSISEAAAWAPWNTILTSIIP